MQRVTCWLLSSTTRRGLRGRATALLGELAGRGGLDVHAVAAALWSGDGGARHRCAIVGSEQTRLLDGLAAVARGEISDGVTYGSVAAGSGGCTFLYPGQGGQWPSMGVQLYRAHPAFRDRMDECAELLDPLLDTDTVAALHTLDSDLDLGEAVQPLLYAVACGLTAVWHDLGVEPDAVVGHSIGEFAAAHAAGTVSPSDAARVVAARARSVRAISGSGGMLAVRSSAVELGELIGSEPGQVWIAGRNGPRATVLAGRPDALAAVRALLDGRGIPHSTIGVDHPAHSPIVDAVEPAITGALTDLAPRPGRVPYYSAMLGGPVDGPTMDGGYWYRNLREPVLLDTTIARLVADGHRRFVEIGPHPLLVPNLEESLDELGVPGVVVASMVRGSGTFEDIVGALARLHVSGGEIAWERGLLRDAAPLRPPLPAAVWHDAPAPARASGPSRSAVLDTVVRCAADALDLPPARLVASRSFADAGLSSVSAVALRNRLAETFDVRLPVGLIFDQPTPRALARWLHRRLTDPDGTTDTSPVEPARPESDDPVVIVGMSCRFPGGVGSAEDLWHLVASGTDAIGGFPRDRGWNLARLYDPEPGTPGRTYSRAGGFLTGATEFDAAFFGISPREAAGMDPQQRQLLEVSWEALENAGIPPGSLRGTETGVFTGLFPGDYGPRMAEARGEHGGYVLTGTIPGVASGRVSYVLGLEGPSVSVDTACSSSLVALHLAARSLRSGESRLAMAGAATVMATPGIFVEFARQRGLAADGRCKAYSTAADGTGWSEGAAVLVLERLSDATASGHPVLAVLRGSAVNSDGASNGLTAPSGPAQQRVIRRALADAALGPADVDAVEGHGTGTPLGDPIEAQALIDVYGRDRDRPLLLGSVKSNIGHTQAAGGLAGVIKMVAALRHELLPATLHVDTPSSHVGWEAGAVELLTSSQAWPRERGRSRRFGVSSFGVSGTNTHAVFEEPPAPPTIDASGPASWPASWPVSWLVSGRTPEALRAQAARLATWVRERPALDPAAVARALAVTRTHFEVRAAVRGADRAELLAGLDRIVDGSDGAGRRPVASGLVWVFPGQGGQWAGMAARLLVESAVFAAAIDECEQALAPHVDWSLTDVLRDGGGLDRVDVVQPALFAVMVALARLWTSCGVRPDAVIGHSQGEIAAAVVAGALSTADGARVVALRSRALRSIAGGHAGMLSVTAPADGLAPLVRRWGTELAVAAVNGPESVVVSGSDTAIGELADELTGRGVRCDRIKVDYAAHSAAVEPLRERLLADLDDLAPRPPDVPFLSAVTGDEPDGPLDGEYWYRNLRETVRFDEALRAAAEAGHRIVIEVSPHPVLVTGAVDTLAAVVNAADGPAHVLGTLRRDHGGTDRFVTALTDAHVAGVPVDWHAILGAPSAVPAELPTYAFQRTRHWAPSPSIDPAGPGGTGHPLLDARIDLPGDEGTVMTGCISRDRYPWIADHVVFGEVTFPGTGFVELALAAGHLVGCARVDELLLQRPLIVPEDGEVAVQLRLTGPGRRELACFADDGTGEWVLHATARLAPTDTALPAHDDLRPPADAVAIPLEDAYDLAAGHGLDYGPAFRGLRELWRAGTGYYGVVELPGTDPGGFAVHPVLTDAALQPLVSVENIGLPFAWRGIAAGTLGTGRLRFRLGTADDGAFGLVMADADGRVVVRIDAVEGRPVTAADVGGGDLFHVRWKEVDGLAEASTDGWAVLGVDGPPGLPCYPDVRTVAAAPGGPPAHVVVHVGAGSGADLAAAARATAASVLKLAQSWLAEPRLSGSTLVVCTTGAVTAREGDVPDLACAPVWGLMRSAQTEHPGRFVVADLDDPAGTSALFAAVRAGHDQVALRVDRAYVPALAPLGSSDPGPTAAARRWAPGGTVVITGGTGTLGAAIARYAVTRQAAGCVLLASRSGPAATGAAELVAELTSLGARVEVLACDVSERTEVARLLATVPEGHPLTAVVHAAAVLDDAVLEAIDAPQLARIFGPKVDGALHLHELTRDMDLAGFVLMSSAMGVFGGAGQGGYAGANTVLDALAEHRQAAGLPGCALAWGLWARASGLTGDLTDADRARLRRTGLAPIPTERGVALLDDAIHRGVATAAPVHLDRAALRALAETGSVPEILRDLAPAGGRPATPTAGPAATLVELPDAERRHRLQQLVAAEVAAVLGHAANDAVHPTVPFRDLGFDSLTAVELRNRVAGLTGLRLPATLVFNHPTVAALAEHLGDLMTTTRTTPRTSGTRPAAVAGDPVVIVGMGCRYPGGVESAATLWDLVLDGRQVVGELPDDRGWNLDELLGPGASGTSTTAHGAFLPDVAGFDAAFFGIGPREATAMDPQQRLLLEVSWEALEHAGIAPTSLSGSRTGVVAGVMYHDYLGGAGAPPGDLEGHIAAGTAGSVVSGRVAYALGLEGPAISVDTACSSSLVALHWAAQSLRTGEADLMLAGGVTVLASPSIFVEFSRQGGLAADGRCKSFSDAADGTAWGEGAGVVVLERLSDALAHGHEVLAVLRGSAVNSDGASNGLTAPNGSAQQRVIEHAIAAAGLTSADVDVVEAHGTGTTLGDPIEAQALLATYGRDRPADRPLWLGSVKSNIGHTQAAAGVAGVIKMVEAMQHGVLPRSLHSDTPSTKVDWTSGGVSLLAASREWCPTGRPRRAGVSSFGISGTNAHLILEQHAGAPSGERLRPEPEAALWPLSARSAAGLRAQAARLAAWVRERPALRVDDVGLSLGTTRAHLDLRATVAGADRTGLLDALDRLSAGQPHPGAATGTVGAGSLAMLFPGQGSQHPGMAAGLYRAYPVFADALDEVCASFDGLLPRPLRDVLLAQEGDTAELLARTAFAQPALFATGVAAHRLAVAHGVVPDVLAGHSIGEVAAAHVAGVFSLSDGCRLVAARAAAMESVAGRGAMVAVEATEEDVAAELAGRNDVTIAAVNGTRSIVLSGDADAVLDVADGWRARGHRTRRLGADRAFHSAHLDPVLGEFRAAVDTIAFHAPRLPVLSNVSGRIATDEELRSPAYWVTHARHAVRFADDLDTMYEHGVRRFVEAAPGSTLTGLAARHLGLHEPAVTCAPLLRDDLPAAESVLGMLGRLHVAGQDVDWSAIHAPTGAVRVPLPTYAFAHRRFWGVRRPAADAPEVVAEAPVETVRVEEEDLGALLAALSDVEREMYLVRLVTTEAAAALGHTDVASVDARTAFMSLGFTSLTAVELRNRLTLRTGLQLPPTVVFDHPDVTALAREIRDRLAGGDGSAPGAVVDGAVVDGAVAELERHVAGIAADDRELRVRTARRLRALVRAVTDGSTAGADVERSDAVDEPTDLADRLRSASAEDLIHYLDHQGN